MTNSRRTIYYVITMVVISRYILSLHAQTELAKARDIII